MIILLNWIRTKIINIIKTTLNKIDDIYKELNYKGYIIFFL